MVDIKPWTYAEHVNPMPHGGFDVTHHIPILDHPTKEPTHAVSPSCCSRTASYGNGVTRAYLFGCRKVTQQGQRARPTMSVPPPVPAPPRSLPSLKTIVHTLWNR